MKKLVVLVTITLLVAVVGFYFYYLLPALPNNEVCLQKVQRENSFCENLIEEQCRYYQNVSNSIPEGGNCLWIEESSVCVGATGGCD